MSDGADFAFDVEAALALFAEECAERLTDLREGLLALGVRPGDDETIQRIFRAAHTIKGNAGSFGFDGLAAAAGSVEGLLGRVRSRAVAIDEGLVSLLLEAHDALRTIVAETIEGSPEPMRSHRPLFERVDAAARHDPAPRLAPIPSQDASNSFTGPTDSSSTSIRCSTDRGFS